MLYRQKISPSAEIQLPSEIKHKGLHGSVSQGSVARKRTYKYVSSLALPRRFEIQDWTDAAKRNLEKGRKKEESSEARMNRFFFCAVARWQIAGAGR